MLQVCMHTATMGFGMSEGLDTAKGFIFKREQRREVDWEGEERWCYEMDLRGASFVSELELSGRTRSRLGAVLWREALRERLLC